ncbi:MAG: hypothetical protein R3Y27_03645 [Clostridia bacterium]
MNSTIKLKSKMLILDKNLFLTLVMLIALAMAVVISSLPYVAQSFISILLGNQKQFLSVAVQLIVSFVILIFAISSFSAWNLGVDRYFLKSAQLQKASMKDIFYYFSIKRIFPASWFLGRLFLVKLCFFVLCQIPTIILISVMIFQLSTQLSITVGAVLSVGVLASFVSGFIFYKLTTSSFFLMKYSYISGQYKGFLSALSQSGQIMNSSKASPFSMQLSFTAWLFSCVFIIPFVYVWSYYRQARAVLATEIMQ